MKVDFVRKDSSVETLDLEYFSEVVALLDHHEHDDGWGNAVVLDRHNGNLRIMLWSEIDLKNCL